MNFKILVLILAYLMNLAHDFHPHSHESGSSTNLKGYSTISFLHDHDHGHENEHRHHDHDSESQKDNDSQFPFKHSHFQQGHEYLQVITPGSDLQECSLAFLANRITEPFSMESVELEILFPIEFDIYNSFLLKSICLRAPPHIS